MEYDDTYPLHMEISYLESQWDAARAEADNAVRDNMVLRLSLRQMLSVMENSRKFVAYAFSQGIDGAEDAGLEIDAAIKEVKNYIK